VSTPYRQLNHLLTSSRASILAPLPSRRATTSLRPHWADMMIGVNSPYPRQREGSEIVIIRDHIKPDLKKEVINICIHIYIQTYIQIYSIEHPQILLSVTSSCALIVSTNSLFYFLTSYTNNSHVGTYTYNIYMICTVHTYIHRMHEPVYRRRRTYLYVWVWEEKKASPPPYCQTAGIIMYVRTYAYRNEEHYMVG
jgi:hypothetical protein